MFSLISTGTGKTAELRCFGGLAKGVATSLRTQHTEQELEFGRLSIYEPTLQQTSSSSLTPRVMACYLRHSSSSELWDQNGPSDLH